MTGARGWELDMFWVGACLDTELIRVLGTMRGVGGGGVLVGGGVKEMQGHTGDEKTTKRWEADDHARDRLKIRRVGEDNQNGTVGCVCLVTATVQRS